MKNQGENIVIDKKSLNPIEIKKKKVGDGIKHVIANGRNTRHDSMKSNLFKIVTLILLLFPMMVHAQLLVTPADELPGWTADDLVRNIFLNSGVQVSNVKFNGSIDTIYCDNIGIFETGTTPTNLGIESGVIIATGNVKVAKGPNECTYSSMATNCDTYSDSNLESIATASIHDVAVLEFDFVPWDSVLKFNYVFGSEEYMEFVGQEYNDVFGFFVTGPNPAGGYYNNRNMAVIPNTNEEVSINNVNLNHNPEYFVNNPVGSNTTIQFDGFTTVLEVRFDVVPMGNYHIKMAICDVEDNNYDSGVFLESNSLSTNAAVLFVDGKPSMEYPDGFDVCKNAPVDFNVNLSFNPSNIVWNFGDGTSGSGIPTTHLYTDIGDYDVSCDIYEQGSLVLTLTTMIHVHEGSQSELWDVACDSYTCFGQTFTQSGDYTVIGQTTYGCDSTIMLHLTINHSDTTNLYETACDYFYWYDDRITQSGIYEHLEHNSARCDSLIILNLTIYGTYSQEEEVVACDSYYWRGNEYTHSGTFRDVSSGPTGCDSTFVLHLTIGQSHDINLNDTVCDFYPWASAPDGFLTQSGHYTFTGQSMGGCDSIVNLDIIVNQTPKLEILGLTEVAVSTDLWPGIYNYCLADSAELHGCDIHWSCSNPDWILMPATEPIWCKLIAKSLGQATLTAVSDCGYGCDTLCSLDINSSYFDVDETETQTIILFPNPTHGQVTIQAPQLRHVKFYNMYGVVSKDLSFELPDMVNIDITDLAQGFYIVEIVTVQGKTSKKLFVLK